MLPLECWTEILEWLEDPEEIDRISLVKPGFYSIFERKFHRKYGEEKKMVPDLRFYRENGTAKLFKLSKSPRNVPIAKVPPPSYLAPTKQIFVR